MFLTKSADWNQCGAENRTLNLTLQVYIRNLATLPGALRAKILLVIQWDSHIDPPDTLTNTNEQASK